MKKIEKKAKTTKKVAAKKSTKTDAKAKTSIKKPLKVDVKVKAVSKPAAAPKEAPKITLVHATTGVTVSGDGAKKRVITSGTVTIPRKTFQEDLAVAHDFIEKKSTLHALTHVLLDADGKGNATLTATNLEQHWSKVLAVKGDKVARCIPAALLLKEVKALPSETESIVLVFKENGEVHVNDRCILYTLHADEFPTWTVPKMTELTIDNLVPSLGKVAHAMGEEDSRYVLNGALLDTKDNMVAATDGHRIAYDNIGIRGKADSVIIPRRAVLLMVKYPESSTPKLVRDAKVTLAQDSLIEKHKYDLDVFGHRVQVKYDPMVVKSEKEKKDKLTMAELEWSGPISDTAYLSEHLHAEKLNHDVHAAGSLKGWLQYRAEERYIALKKTVGLSVCPTMISYPCSGGVMMSKTIDGNYPNWRAVVPTAALPVKVKFEAQAFLQTVAGVMPLTNDALRVNLHINGKLRISSSQAERGTFNWSIPCETTGKSSDITIGFNIRYLVDAIKAFSGKDVLLEITDPVSPCRVNTNAVVMPMKG